MKWIKSCFIAVCCLSMLTACQEKATAIQDENPSSVQKDAQPSADERNLIVYFSRYGNSEYLQNIDANTAASIVIKDEIEYGTTQLVADKIQQLVGGDIHKIQTVESYPSDFEELKQQNHEELKRHDLPALEAMSLDMSQYDTIFIGYPVWASTIPQAIRSFLSTYDVEGKVIIPFCTHDGYGAGISYQEIAEAAKNASVLDGLSIAAKDVLHAQDEVADWLSSLGFSTKIHADTSIQVNVQGEILEGVLYDNALAQEMLQQFPITVSMSGYGEREYYGGIAFTPKQAIDGQLQFEDGDITYCAKNNTMAIFYSQSEQPDLTMEVQPIGRITSDLEIFTDLPSNVEITFSIK